MKRPMKFERACKTFLPGSVWYLAELLTGKTGRQSVRLHMIVVDRVSCQPDGWWAVRPTVQPKRVPEPTTSTWRGWKRTQEEAYTYLGEVHDKTVELKRAAYVDALAITARIDLAIGLCRRDGRKTKSR